MKTYLIAVDMEGVHGVSGLPYDESPTYGMPRNSDEYARAVAAATQEINVVVDELFANGANRVVVWDNHGGGSNLDFSKIDPRAEQYTPDNSKPRMEFMDRFAFDGVLYIGYHSRAGSLRGVMSHTYNSIQIQYMKIDGEQVGEFDVDSAIAASYGVPSIFVASDDVCIGQVLRRSPETETVITKIGISRRKAQFRDEGEVLAEIREGVKRAVEKNLQPKKLAFPCAFEIRSTKQELAEINFEKLSKKIPIEWGEDAHTIRVRLNNIDELRLFLLVF
ncbi:MAG: M55 family metallopeptidase [Clostridia bacterium]|nr:M55 family metallopeptidase [Clostridia bacterium]MBQ8447150.1 M55 family metallopeptidase [Clostridia bacterium]